MTLPKSGKFQLTGRVLWSTCLTLLLNLQKCHQYLKFPAYLTDFLKMSDQVPLFPFFTDVFFFLPLIIQVRDFQESFCTFSSFVKFTFLTCFCQWDQLVFTIFLWWWQLFSSFFWFEFKPFWWHLLLLFYDHSNNCWMTPCPLKAFAKLFPILFCEVWSFIKINWFFIFYGRLAFGRVKFPSFYRWINALVNWLWLCFWWQLWQLQWGRFLWDFILLIWWFFEDHWVTWWWFRFFWHLFPRFWVVNFWVFIIFFFIFLFISFWRSE